jgi:hypothetical protein
MDANAKLNAVPLDTSMSVICNFNCELVGKLPTFSTFICVKVVRLFLVNNSHEI